MAKKKSYNPFKMWGSYIGAIVYPLIIIGLSFLAQSGEDLFGTLARIVAFPLVWITLNGCQGGLECLGYAFIVLTFGGLILGFLIGWGIHSLIRKYKK